MLPYLNLLSEVYHSVKISVFVHGSPPVNVVAFVNRKRKQKCLLVPDFSNTCFRSNMKLKAKIR